MTINLVNHRRYCFFSNQSISPHGIDKLQRIIKGSLKRWLAIVLASHQQAADQLRRNQLGGAGEGWGERWEGRGGYWSGLGDG